MLDYTFKLVFGIIRNKVSFSFWLIIIFSIIEFCHWWDKIESKNCFKRSFIRLWLKLTLSLKVKPIFKISLLLFVSIVVYEGGSVMHQARSLWRLELARTKWAGGYINWFHPIRIRHITTGLYLGVKDDATDLCLLPK